ncbi:protein of unknown function [Shinella sp. WSC3-e]|nr:hypothetical protein SHINE37_40794 [Rhizobiaceae bacterium]CAK7255467.1 protein of unknown function [Shinella sp. WSC3-e]
MILGKSGAEAVLPELRKDNFRPAVAKRPARTYLPHAAPHRAPHFHSAVQDKTKAGA